jgi:DNA-binding NarL/FixJ family response regulator
MTAVLRVLILEDAEADVDLIRHELDHAAMRAQLRRVDSRDRFVDALRDFAPDVVVTDRAVSEFSASDAIELVRASRPGTPVIVIARTLDTRAVVALVRLGAEDVVLKANLRRLPAAITAASKARRRLHKLSPRQVQVLRFVAEGETSPAIAKRLHLSVKTVETHRAEMMKRLGEHDISALVRYAVRVGIVGAAES